tara:strand:+ start:35 stop:163 length:129 start_codon:yes stop_codon:yes gene_type:complete
MKKNILIALALVAGFYANAQTPTTDAAKSVNEVVTADNVEWG